VCRVTEELNRHIITRDTKFKLRASDLDTAFDRSGGIYTKNVR